MPVYRYECNCGRKNDLFLKQDKSSLVLQCDNCGRGTTARQVRDKSAIIAEKDGVTGILRRNG